ncbi:MAG: DUF4129 domain-containing protein [Clostridiales bacterium]|jgi:hypothetical protein|nr:DUF4129 domain-containing protein [Clostridiales bacterium]
MSFNEAMNSALLNAKYNKLTGRYFDWREWIAEKFMAIVNWVLGHLNQGTLTVSEGGGWAQVFIIIIIITLTAAVAAVIILSRRRRKRRLLSAIFNGVDQKAAPASLLTRANIFFAEGKTRDAVRYCFAAVLLMLNETRVLRVTMTKTNRQFLRELRFVAPTLMPRFERISAAFDRVWFGHKGLTAEEFADVKNAASAMIVEGGNVKKAV